MTVLKLTAHATERMAQRGIRARDVELAMLLATEGEGGFVVLRRDCEDAIRTLKRLVQDVERLEGARLVCSDGVLITIYRTSREAGARLVKHKPRNRDARSRAVNDRRHTKIGEPPQRF
jgi:glucokinase